MHYLKKTSRCFTTISKRCRLNKLTRQRFDLTLKKNQSLSLKRNQATQTQQRRKFSSGANSAVGHSATQIQQLEFSDVTFSSWPFSDAEFSSWPFLDATPDLLQGRLHLLHEASESRPLMEDARIPFLATYKYPIVIAEFSTPRRNSLSQKSNSSSRQSSAEVFAKSLSQNPAQIATCPRSFATRFLVEILRAVVRSLAEVEMAPSVPRTRAAAALRMKQIALDNQIRTIRRLRAQLATERRGLATRKKELEDTQEMAPSVPRTRAAAALRMKQIALDNQIRTISMSKKIEKMKVKKQLAKANHVECHQKFQARIHEAEDSMQAQHLIIEALVDEKDSLLQTIQGLQEANNAPAPFDGDWEEESEEEPEEEEIEDIPLGEGEIDDE
ncbi:hypothetical protein F511_42162 [Dorcoceras hygrometricum]|uniref:Uncharacterized protein n=1 Tax=Dorcoceras hygrometricum TaxID=472368 RepID=A0A2Z7C311_9LAMI|nr:hypothetical protein F511_42162 [Dorcoceras hygrometricum]